MITLSSAPKTLNGDVRLPSSKSESNRALIMRALAPEEFTLDNLSSARDTQTMIRLLASEGHVLDVIDAGTTMRFLTAYCAAVGRDQILTGTPRMCKRPIGLLVEALRELGGNIEYWKQEGYPPLHIIGDGSRMEGGEISIPGNISSQFITAVLMIAPTLKGGLSLHLTGKINSRPYIEMTRGLMEIFGINTYWEGNSIIVPEKEYQGKPYTIESDWSAASYWYSMVAIAEQAEIKLLGLRKTSFQGDARIAELMVPFGVHTEFVEDGVILRKHSFDPNELVNIDFTPTPDLAQTIAVVSAAIGKEVEMTGLETLRIKETDRIFALQQELAKFGMKMEEVRPEVFKVHGTYQYGIVPIHTYEDHRMAMAFAPLIFKQDSLTIEDPSVVNKSYPEFWDHLQSVGISQTVQSKE